MATVNSSLFLFAQPDDSCLVSRNMWLAVYTYTEYTLYLTDCVGRDSLVCIATRYGLDGPGLESWCGRNCAHTLRSAMGPTQPVLQRIICRFPGDIAAKAWR
jgi:hypothetical protein